MLTEEKLNVDFELVKAEDLQYAKVHPEIEAVFDCSNEGFRAFISSLNSDRLYKLTKLDPIIIWVNDKGEMIIIKKALYYFESQINNAKVHILRRKITENEAKLQAADEAYTLPMMTFSALGPNMIVYKNINIKGKPKTIQIKLRGFKKWHVKFINEIFNRSTLLDKRIYKQDLNSAPRIALILNRSPETIYKWLTYLEIRPPRRKQRKPRPKMDPSRKFDFEDKHADNK